MVCLAQVSPETFDKTPSGGQAVRLRPPPLVREEEKKQSRTAEEASMSMTTHAESPTGSAQSHVTVGSLAGSMIDFPADPAWRRKYIALQHVRRFHIPPFFYEFVEARQRALMPASCSRRKEEDERRKT